MRTPEALARAIGLETPVSWRNRWSAVQAAYDSAWLDRYDWDAVLTGYGTDARFADRFRQELNVLRQDSDLNFLCYLIHDILFLAPWSEHYDIWNWSTGPEVYAHWGSPMVNAVARREGFLQFSLRSGQAGAL